MAEKEGVIKYQARDNQEVTLSLGAIKKYLVQGKSELVTVQEAMYFMGICRSRGLNPFNKDCYLMKYGNNDNAAIIVSIDYFRKRAKSQPDCQGWTKGVIVERNGEVVHSKGLVLESDKLLGGWFSAQPKDWREPLFLEVNLSGYIKYTNTGKITKFWNKENQPSQIAKVAESQGLRTVWPDEFQQLYTSEEIQQEPTQPSVKIEPTVETLPDKSPYEVEEFPPPPVLEEDGVKEEPESESTDFDNSDKDGQIATLRELARRTNCDFDELDKPLDEFTEKERKDFHESLRSKA
ncbi:MAG: phage recombination protein Bet [Deltaproteobacteria bacterium]|nr:MAG: phage recombination protein Bet [Deltaproteobacteria bacterium]